MAEDLSGQSRVTVLLATRNGGRHLPEQLASLARQSHGAWDLIVSDDGSTDDTVAVLDRFAAQHPGRVRLLPPETSGSAKRNFFRLLREAPVAERVALCDQDDVWRADKLERLLAACAQTEQASAPDVPVLVASDLAVVDAELHLVARSFLAEIRTDPERITLRSTLAENALPGCAMLLNGALLRVFRDYPGPLDDALMHDWWLALIAESLGVVRVLPEPLVQYRQHDANAAGSVHRSGVRFVVRKVAELRPRAVPGTYRQARLLANAYGARMDAGIRRVVTEYGDLERRSKLARIWHTLRLGVLKQTSSRRIYQVLRA
ncbi:glycosyltransferase family 2 protein [Microbacterium caowuchunii]|uniref:Glycosyltransferase family 2 protein n=1 Tax=Microbacterium caowuchunii TaxID=2614638 RepID=A0A5N0TGJ1_9MICO|nr:glycosyltransferase family 2 protein [Microbacterium caowuchunii]KAA9132399.1 glycosyltransferase family 2 protein [Microbacterium caowuchunii]